MLVAACSVACAAVSAAQSTAVSLVQAAFQNLRAEPSIWMRMTGTDAINGNGVALIADTFWYTTYSPTGQPISKLEMTEFRNGVLSTRIVGDGTTLWAYNVAKNEYAASNYGAINAPSQPPTYQQALLQGFGSHAKGQIVHPARLLREVYSGGFALYRPWLIAAQERVVQGTQSFDDPVLGAARRYQATPTQTFLVFWTGSPATRSLAFGTFLDQNTNTWKLGSVYYADSSAVGSNSRLVEWGMSIQPVQPSVGNFLFVPPNGARAIVRPGG